MAKFKVGDIVIGNEKANIEYGITKQGWKGRVIAAHTDFFIAEGWDDKVFYHLLYDCFDLYNPTEFVLGLDIGGTSCMISDEKLSINTDFINFIEDRGNNMKILEIYKERTLNKLFIKYNDEIKEIESFDSIQSLINDTQDQLNALLGREDDDKVTISVNNLHGAALHDDITQVKIEEATFNYQNQKDKLYNLIEEVEALLEMTSDYNEQIKILKKYGILDKEGKLHV